MRATILRAAALAAALAAVGCGQSDNDPKAVNVKEDARLKVQGPPGGPQTGQHGDALPGGNKK